MFNKNFYPTPKNIINKMCEGITQKGLYILEPSAGKGDILDYLKDGYTNYHSNKLFCIEIEPELRMILKEKHYKIVGNDFLSYSPDYNFDYIIMNPPFDVGATHLLHAFRISDGAEIRCLLNEETIKNPYSKERQLLLNTIKENGGIVTPLGNCFTDAERTTNINVVMVTLQNKTKRNTYDIDFKNTGTEKKYSVNDIDNKQIATSDVFENMETRFNKVKELYVEQLKLEQEIAYYSSGLGDAYKLATESNSGDYKQRINDFNESFRNECWNSVMSKTKLSSIVTKSVREQLESFKKEQTYMAFTKDNMEDLFYTLMENKGNIAKNCIVDAFDEMTKYNKDNRLHFEGWKTNDSWKVNKKVIFPWAIDTSWLKYASDKNKLRIHYNFNTTIADIEKAMCFITGKKYEDIDSIADKDQCNVSLSFGEWHDSEFFEFRGFKKGTMHIKFKSEKVYQEFNKIACDGKNWLPEKS